MSHITPAGSPGQRVAVPAAALGEVEALETSSTPSDGRSTRWEQHRAERRAELVRAARKAVHRHGPDISMDEIATTAGTSKSIVYRYFADKTGLQVAVGEAVVDQMHTALDEAARAATTPREALRSMIDVYLEMVEGSPNVYWFVTRPVTEDASAPLGNFLEAVATLIARPFARVMTAGSAEVDQADIWAAGAVGFVRGSGEWWLRHRDDEGSPTREELTERVAAWLWAGPVSVLARSRADDGSRADDAPRSDHSARTDDTHPTTRPDPGPTLTVEEHR